MAIFATEDLSVCAITAPEAVSAATAAIVLRAVVPLDKHGHRHFDENKVITNPCACSVPRNSHECGTLPEN